MPKNKIAKFEEIDRYSHVVQPSFREVFNKKHSLYGKWHSDFFGNKNPLVLELGCGKGEYTVGLAERYPGNNYLGVDIKGARIWKGARQVYQQSLKNVGFLRTRIELLNAFFSHEEVSAIWLPFPDPQSKKPKKRLTSPRFLNMYKEFLKKGGLLHLKTDSSELYYFTLNVIKFNNLELIISSADLYNSDIEESSPYIKTFYEEQFLSGGKKIHYLKFKIPEDITVEWPPEDLINNRSCIDSGNC